MKGEHRGGGGWGGGGDLSQTHGIHDILYRALCFERGKPSTSSPTRGPASSKKKENLLFSFTPLFLMCLLCLSSLRTIRCESAPGAKGSLSHRGGSEVVPSEPGT